MASNYPLQNWLEPNDLAHRFGVSHNTVLRWIWRYGIGIKVGGRWRIDPTTLEATQLVQRPGYRNVAEERS